MVVGYCEHLNEPSGFVKGGEFLDELSVLLACQEVLVVGVCYFLINTRKMEVNVWHPTC